MIYREDTLISELHRFALTDRKGKIVGRFEYDRSRDTKDNDATPFWFAMSYVGWDQMHDLAALKEAVQRSTWQENPDEYLASLYPNFEDRKVKA